MSVEVNTALSAEGLSAVFPAAENKLYNWSVLFQVINSMFLTKYVCLSLSVFVNNNNFSNQHIHKLKFINSPLYFSFPLVFFICDGTTKNQCFKT